MSLSQSSSPAVAGDVQGQPNTRALVIVTILFFMWGLLTSLNDVLIPHLKSIYTLTYVQAMLVQFCFFGAYFVVSVPAGSLVRRIGYQNGAVAGLVIAASGCLMFYPAATSGYALFLFAFFVLAAGITILQVAANPFVTLLGDARTASSRLTLTQAFNSLGTTVGPPLGGALIFGGAVALGADALAKLSPEALAAHRAAEAATVQGPYLMLAGALLLLAVLFAFARLPRIAHEDTGEMRGALALVRQHRNLLLGALAIFLYVGAEVSIGSFLVSFLGEENIAGFDHEKAAYYLTYYWGGAMVGRFLGFAVMRKVSPGRVLGFNGAAAVLLLVVAIIADGPVAMWAVLAVGLFNSIMFPTIFSIALHGLGAQTGQGSGVLCMAIVGGAIVPFAQGYMADTVALQPSFLVPLACYVFILYYGLRNARTFQAAPAA